VVRQRITWIPSADGARGASALGDDDGATWVTAFDGRYRRIPGVPDDG